MAQKFKDKIFIIDKQIKNHIKQIPAYNDMAKDFELVDTSSIYQKGFFKRLFNKPNIQVVSNNTLMSLDEYQKTGHLIRSELYFDRYYPLFEYINTSYEELAALMAKLCNFMGDDVEFRFEFNEENFDSVELDKSTSVKAKGNYKGINVKADAKLSNNSKQEKEYDKRIDFKTRVANAKKTPKELDKYIKDNKINLRALPHSFKALVETYIDSNSNAQIKNYESQEYTISNATKYLKICKEFSSKADIMNFLKADFNLELDSQSSCLHRVKTKIIYSVIFHQTKC